MNFLKRAFPYFSFIIFSVIIGFLYFQLEELLAPHRLKAEIQDGIDDYIETSNLEIGSIRSEMGTSGEIIVSDLEIRSRENIPLLRTTKARVKIPYYALLVGGGRIRVELTGLSIDYPEFVKHFDREKFLSGLKKKRFFDKSRLGFKVYGLELKLGETEESVIDIQKILLKNFSSKLQTAFEVDSPFVFKFSESRKLNLDLLAIGEFSLSKLLEKEVLKSSVFIKVSGIKTVDDQKIRQGEEIREVHGNIDFSADSLTNAFGEIEFTGDESYLTSDFNFKDRRLQLKNFESSLNADIFEKLGVFQSEGIDLRNIQVAAKGMADISPDMSLSPKLKFNLSQPINHDISGIPLNYRVEGEILPHILDVSLESQLLEGEVSYDFIAKHHFKLHNLGPDKLEQGSLNVEIRDINLERAVLKDQTFFPIIEKAVENLQGPSFPVNKVKFNLNKVQFQDKDLQSQGQLIQSQSGRSANLSFDYGEGSLNLEFDEENKDSKMKLRMSSLDVKGLRPFLPTSVWEFSGKMSSNIESEWKSSQRWKEIEGKGDFRVTNGSFPSSSFSSELNDLLSKVTGKEITKTFNLNKFSLLEGDLELRDKVLGVENFYYVDLSEVFSLSGGGEVSLQEAGKSELIIQMEDMKEKIWKIGKENELPKIIPLKLVGEHLELEPDIFYTLNELGKTKDEK